MKKYYKIYYYQVTEKEDNKVVQITYHHHIQFENIIVKVRSPWPGSVLSGKVNVMRPDVNITKFKRFSYDLDPVELLKRIDTSEKVNPNVNYLLERVKDELGRIRKESK